jgi:hypothetical protein
MDRRHRIPVVIVALAAIVTSAFAQAPKPAVPAPGAADVRRIQESEARKSDERTLAYLARFRAALVARFGPDPKLTMLTVSEVEGTALVVTGAEPPEFVIWQEGKWFDTQGRELKPWATPEVAAANAFPLSLLRESAIRAAMQEWRRSPAQATDFLGDLGVGYDPRGQRVVVRHTASSMTEMQMKLFTYDPQTGQRITIVGPVRKTQDPRPDIEQALIALRDAAPGRRLGSVHIARSEVVFVFTDRTTLRFDVAYELAPGDRDEFAAVCAEGFAEADVDWSRIAELPREAVARANLDAEDIPFASFDVDRGRSCGPVVVEVAFDNYRAPKPRVRFDARGAFLGKAR